MIRYKEHKNVTVSWSLQPKLHVPINGLLGNILIAADNTHVPNKKYKISKAGYHHRYPRTNKTYLRTLKAVEIMRYRYRYSTNNIALGLQINTRTVKKRLKDLYKMGYKIFNCMRNRLYRSKNSAMRRTLRTISARVQSYIDGRLTLLELYASLGIKPPPSPGTVPISLFLIYSDSLPSFLSSKSRVEYNKR